MENGTCYAYLLRCADGTLYAGWTNDPAARLEAHNEGRGAKYTRGRLPVEMVYREAFGTRAEAMRREWELKQMTRAQKLALIAQGAGHRLKKKLFETTPAQSAGHASLRDA
ncbi:GIY-YIG nuclease family protein [uncultured Anaerotruncus sp.]|uniref:GIY-YIG nuclease family protein n=1 Tax=uncultured Anaerotruncus sp. TaxID=905011 RepID=UPI00280BDC52|nr:GIY-YIG nuclease family protein [uncultured Anaerotruncus sp.]